MGMNYFNDQSLSVMRGSVTYAVGESEEEVGPGTGSGGVVGFDLHGMEGASDGNERGCLSSHARYADEVRLAGLLPFSEALGNHVGDAVVEGAVVAFAVGFSSRGMREVSSPLTQLLLAFVDHNGSTDAVIAP